MSCSLTQNYVLDCKDNVGGIKLVWICALESIGGITETDGVVSIINSAGNGYIYKYDLVRESSMFTETITTNVQNGTVFYAQSLEIILNKLQVNTRNEILLLAKNRVVVIAQDNNGRYWMLGKLNGLDATAGGSASGTAFGDRNGYTITFTGSERELAPEVVDNAWSGLID
jgi:hypothetical protein